MRIIVLVLRKLKKLRKDVYHVVSESSFKNGYLNYGELIIPGKSKDEILISTNICHPSMGNNETSGIVVATALANWVSKLKIEDILIELFLFLKLLVQLRISI